VVELEPDWEDEAASTARPLEVVRRTARGKDGSVVEQFPMYDMTSDQLELQRLCQRSI
jgi:hypothetical protein